MPVFHPGQIRFLLVFVVAVMVDGGIRAADDVRFARDVLPILSDKCFTCHGPDAREGQLRLDSAQAAGEDLGGYRAIDSETPGDSELLLRIFDEDDPMPPEDAEKSLSAEEREVLKQWVMQGGEYEEHWAFVPPTRIGQAVDAKEAIDTFISRQHQVQFEASNKRVSNKDTSISQSQEIDFAPRADRPALARRLGLVLTGLPPEEEQLSRYLNNDNESVAYPELVDSLLASPRFGEHQARYWLDAVRYGDTHGLHLDNRRGIYPYRDWVVRAFNDNLPIDDFIVWQLAGDLLPNPTTEQLIATGFVRLNPSTGEGGAIPAEFQAKNNFDRTETLGTVLLGMTMVCARCHTHKYDPIPHVDYYRLLAFFNSTAESALDGNKYEYAPVLKVPADQASWSHWQSLLSERDELLNRVADKAVSDETMSDETAAKQLLALAGVKEESAEKSTDVGQVETSPVEPAMKESAKALVDRFEKAQAAFVSTLIARDLPKSRETRVLERGEYDQPTGDPLVPDALSVLGGLPADAPRNRLGLAQWLTSRDQPLVARVLVNRLWQRVFGEGLVRTPEDFGLQGEQPTHPELLDWLAVEFQESGWDLKHLLRLMVHSRTFQQSSVHRPELGDPENRLWARGPGFRLDAEIIRDMALWSSGLLDPHMGGEGVKPFQPPGMWRAMSHPRSNTKEYKHDRGKKTYRRSLYVYWKRTSPHPLMTLFDAPDRESSCVRRSRTSTALQSLLLFNETQRLEMGRAMAAALLQDHDADSVRIQSMFQKLACRDPDKTELAACQQLLEVMRKRYRDSPAEAKSLIVGVGGEGVDTSERLPVVEHAAWTQVAMTVLASELALMLY